MKIALIVKTVELNFEKNEQTYKGDSVVNLCHSDKGLIFSRGVGKDGKMDSFEVSWHDFALLTDIVNNLYGRIQKEQYVKEQAIMRAQNETGN